MVVSDHNRPVRCTDIAYLVYKIQASFMRTNKLKNFHSCITWVICVIG
jgi:hypothetical protein